MRKKDLEKLKNQAGYTIIETMVAITLFLVVIMFGMGALLNANLVNKKSQDIRSIMDSLSFIMEDISRNVRTGYGYHCIDDGDFSSSTIILPKSCTLGGAVAFESSPLGSTTDPDDQWVYKISSSRTDANGNPVYDINKSTDSGTSWVQLNPDEVVLSSFSGFSVLGAEDPASGDEQEPFVIIKLVGSITFKGETTPFSLQTSISQRLIDL